MAVKEHVYRFLLRRKLLLTFLPLSLIVHSWFNSVTMTFISHSRPAFTYLLHLLT